ncbi:MAG: flagellin [Methanomicrobiales archaeon]|nr:flagellin [Methanomicrobiales archaeon]
MKKEQAFSGLEAAIVLIAFVVVAAVFSYVMLGAGFFATQKAQEVTYSGIQQATSNMVIDGNIYGTMGATGLKQIYFWVNVPIGGQAQKLSDVVFSWSSKQNIGPTEVLHETGTGDATASKFKATDGETTEVTTLQPGEKAYIAIGVPGTTLPAQGDWFTLEMKPKIGAATLTKKTLTTGYDGGVIT